MKNQNISNGLLSSILGVECEFFSIQNNNVFFACGDAIMQNENIEYIERLCVYKINLDTFLRTAKIWAFENGYDIVERGLTCLVTEAVTKKEKYSANESRDEKISFWATDYNIFIVDSILGCLEWINKELEG